MRSKLPLGFYDREITEAIPLWTVRVRGKLEADALAER
jgi:hypothetical protein